MISYIAHIPHSPLVLPNISKDKFSEFTKLYKSVLKIVKEIQNADCDTIITITAGGYENENSYIFNVAPKFEINFAKFGDFATKINAYGEIPLAYWLRQALQEEYCISCITQYELDSLSSIIAMNLQSTDKQYKILPISHALDSAEKLFSFGKQSRDTLERPENKIAIISIGDLSRSIKTQYQTKARKNDESLIQALGKKETKKFLNQKNNEDEFLIRGFGPLTIVLGIIDDMKHTFNKVHYEQKYGVGMLVAQFAL